MLPDGHTNHLSKTGKLVVKVNPYLMVARFSLGNNVNITTTA
jgi:hypothetical protein